MEGVPVSSTDTPRGRRIHIEDGVFVHDCLIYQDRRGSWWAYRDGSVMFSTDQDDLLLQVAHATGSRPDLDGLRGRLGRSVERAARRRAQDEAARVALDGKPASGNG